MAGYRFLFSPCWKSMSGVCAVIYQTNLLGSTLASMLIHMAATYNLIASIITGATGTVFTVDNDGFAQQAADVFTCGWEVERPSGNPEPDFPSDMWTIGPCGGNAARLVDGFVCDSGHRLADYTSAAGRAEEHEAWMAEQYEAIRGGSLR